MNQNPIFFSDLIETIEAIPTESIVSRTIYQDDQLKAIVFAFAPGQELSEHSASVPAIIQILKGTCTLEIGDQMHDASPGAWVYLPANNIHAIKAKTPLFMLLIMMQK